MMHDVTTESHTGVAKATDDTFTASFDIELDDPQPPAREPVYVDVVAADHQLQPVIPAAWRGVTNARRSLARRAQLAGHHAAFHAVRIPFLYVPLLTWWTLLGVVRLVERQLRWWWVTEQHQLRQEAASTGDGQAWVTLHREARTTRAWRGGVLLMEVTALGVWVILIANGYFYATMLLAPAVPLLARLGRPPGKHLLRTAIVAPRFRRLNSDIVLRAYYAAKLGHPDKPDQVITFGSTMSRDNRDRGSQVVIDMPYGSTFAQVMNARDKIASGLDVTTSQVYLTRDKSSERRHLLWVSDVDPLSIPAGRTPLLACQPTNVWEPAPLGVDQRGDLVSLPTVFTSILIGAQPRKGKTFTARLIALYAALDPYCRIDVYDGKGSPDWRKFALVAHTYGFGLLPDRHGDPVQRLLTMLRDAKKDVQQRNQRLSEIAERDASLCPEGKLTPEISRNPAYGMPVRFIVLDEFQEYLSTGDDETDAEIAELLVFLVKVGPSVGVVLLSSTQRPSGIGSGGKVAKRFTDYRDQHQTRFALKVGSWQVSDLILGGGAYGEGWDASTLPVGDEYRGVGILYDAPVPNAMVRNHLADGRDAENILTAARAIRERAGTLAGMAAGDEAQVDARDLLDDVRDVFYAGEAWLAWPAICARLQERHPDAYADLTPDAVSAMCRAQRIESVDGRDRKWFPSGVGKGCKVKAVDEARAARILSAAV